MLVFTFNLPSSAGECENSPPGQASFLFLRRLRRTGSVPFSPLCFSANSQTSHSSHSLHPHSKVCSPVMGNNSDLKHWKQGKWQNSYCNYLSGIMGNVGCRIKRFCGLKHSEEPGAFAVVLPPLYFKSVLNCSSSPGASIRSMVTTLWHRGKRLDYFFALKTPWGDFQIIQSSAFIRAKQQMIKDDNSQLSFCSSRKLFFCRGLTGKRRPQYTQRVKRAVIVHLGF